MMQLEVQGNVITMTFGVREVIANALHIGRDINGDIEHIVFDRDLSRALSGFMHPDWEFHSSFVTEMTRKG